MNVLMVVMSDICTDARVLREAESLSEAGHTVEILAFKYGTVPDVLGIEIRTLQFPDRNTSRARRLLGAASFVLRASARIIRSKADVIHCHNLHLMLATLLWSKFRRRPIVYDAHELVVARFEGRPIPQWVLGYLERRAWENAVAVITTNDSRADHLRKRYGGELPTVVGNYPKITPHRASPLRQHIGAPADAPLLLYQGGLYTESRCFDTVASALTLLPAWHWVIIGFGGDRAVGELSRVFKAAGIMNRVHLLPPVGVDELMDLTAGGDVGVIPLRRTGMNNYLGDTNKLFEYLMAGLPAVGSDFPELRRALIDNGIGPVGAVFDPDDPNSIAESIRVVHLKYAEFKSRAPIVARTRYAWDLEKAKLVAIYSGLVGEDIGE